MTDIIKSNPPYLGIQLELSVLEEFVAAGILVAEGTAPAVPKDWPLISWVRRHIDDQAFEAAVRRGRDMPPGDRGRYLRKALDGVNDD